MQLKNVGTTDVTLVTIRNDPIICIALILSYPSKTTPFPNLRAQQSKFGKHSKIIKSKIPS